MKPIIFSGIFRYQLITETHLEVLDKGSLQRKTKSSSNSFYRAGGPQSKNERKRKDRQILGFFSVRIFGLLSSFLLFFHNVSAVLSPSLPHVSPVYLRIEMIQPGKSFLKFPRLNHFYAQINRRKAGGYSGRNVVKKTIKTKTIVRKLLLTKIIKLRLRNVDSNYLDLV